jgi:hypothetical protein
MNTNPFSLLRSTLVSLNRVMDRTTNNPNAGAEAIALAEEIVRASSMKKPTTTLTIRGSTRI